MATMVCHPGLQPCVDSQFIETTWPRIKFSSSLQFVALNSCFLDLEPPISVHQSNGVDLVLPNHNATDSVLPQSDDAAIAEVKPPMATEKLESESYVLPLVKRSRFTFDEKSLAICTENLGSETGAADFIEDSVFVDFKAERSPVRKRVKSNNRINKKLFPPPLTTIAGPDSICVQSYREDGRLIMAAVEAPARFPYLHAERSHGRLRLSILKSRTPEIESEEESTENEIRIRNDDVEVVGEKGKCEEDVGRKVEENGNLGEVEIEIEKYKKPCSRCNEAGESNNIVENKNKTEMLLFTRSPSSFGSLLLFN